MQLLPPCHAWPCLAGCVLAVAELLSETFGCLRAADPEAGIVLAGRTSPGPFLEKVFNGK